MNVVEACAAAFDRHLAYFAQKAKGKPHVLIVQHPDGSTTHTEHASRTAAHAAAAAHLEANGGKGMLAIAPKGKEHTVHAVPAQGGIKPAGPHGGGSKTHHNQYTKGDMGSASLDAGGRAPPTIAGATKPKKKPKTAAAGADPFEQTTEIAEAMAALIKRVEVFTALDPVRKAGGGKKASYQGIPLVIDRPKGFVQEGKAKDGTTWERLYRYDYGFVPKTEGGDAEGLDVFLGPSANAPVSWWAVQTKDDGAGAMVFDEFKVFLGFASPALAKSCYAMHIPIKFCAGWFPVPVAFMKSLLGVEPRAVIKALMRKAMAKKIVKVEAGVSFDTVNAAIGEALREAYPPAPDPGGCGGSYCYPTEVYEDHVIYSKGDGTYAQESYTFANGVATLAGNAIAVVRTYVPAAAGAPAAAAAPAAGAAAPVTAAAKNATKTEATMKTKTGKAAVKKAGGADIVALAAERLQLVADELGKGDGTITAEISSEIDAVSSLLDTASELYSGAGGAIDPEDDPAQGGDGGVDEETEGDPAKEMADLAAAEKTGGIVKMRGTQFLAYSVAEMKKIKDEKDPMKKALRAASLQKALTYANYWAGAAFTGDSDPTFPVAVFMDAGVPQEVAVPTAGGEPSGLGPAANGGATSVGGSGAQTANVSGSTNFVEKMAEVQKAIDALKGIPEGSTTTTKNEPAAGLWPASYVETLPDTAFLYVEANATKSAGGNTDTAFRHFPIRDVGGKLSKAQLAQAIKMIPTFGATPEFKASLLEKAQGLFGLEASVEKSASLAGARGDDGWPADLTDPDFMQGRKPHAKVAVFGFDNIPDKLEKLGVTGG